MGAFGNLALLRKDLNKRKTDETVPEFLERVTLSNDVELANSADMVTEALFVPPEFLAIPKTPDGEDVLTKEFYVAAIEARWSEMRERLLDALQCT